jgi:hypothetical protein
LRADRSSKARVGGVRSSLGFPVVGVPMLGVLMVDGLMVGGPILAGVGCSVGCSL